MDIVSDNTPLSEPEIIPCVYLSGARICMEHDVLRFTGWEEEAGERRVRVRYAIPLRVALELNIQLGTLLRPVKPDGH